MDKQSSNKPFFIMPEWAWAIVVGMFMLLLFLNHAIPGHASEVTPVPGQVSNYNNYGIYITVKGPVIYVNGMYLLDYSSVVNSNDPEASEDLFFHDATAALTQLFSFIPANQTSILISNDNAYNSAINMLNDVLAQFDCHVGYPIDDVDLYDLQYFPFGQYTIPVMVRKSLVSPTPSPAPEQIQSVIVYGQASSEIQGSVVTSARSYYLIDFYVSSFGSEISFSLSGNNALTGAISTYSLENLWVNNALWYALDGAYYKRFLIYFSGDVSKVRVYNLGSCLVSSDLDSLRASFQYTDFTSSSTSKLYGLDFASSEGLFGFSWRFETRYVQPSFYTSTFPYRTGSQSSYSNYGLFYNTEFSLSCPLSFAYTLGLQGSSADSGGPQPTSTPSPSPSPVPLPTSGESVHVILPTGTPSPTPPFSVPGGSNGDPGSGSPGSVGSGISAAQSSGILSYFSGFLSNNPALAFIAACFPAIPSEILYPLFILLFILMILAAIRLFVHFAGG